MRAAVLATVFFAMAAALGAEDLRHGLMWNRTGLPAVFPLQVKTAEQVDTQVTLYDATSGAPALAAFIEGGRFFKVLVPPGTFLLEFQEWGSASEDASEASLHSAYLLDRALTFEVRDGVKAGFSVDLTDLDTGIVLKGSFICQRQRIVRPSRPLPPFGEDAGYATRLQERGAIARFPNPRHPERLAEGVVRPIIETDFAPYFSRPEFDIRANPC